MALIIPEIYCKHRLVVDKVIKPESINFWGEISIPNFSFVREIAFKVNQKTSRNILPGKIYSAAILSKIFELIIDKYENEFNPYVSVKVLNLLEKTFFKDEINNLVQKYFELFPSRKILLEDSQIKDLILLFENDNSLKLDFLQNLMVLSLQNENRSIEDLNLFFEDLELKTQTIYPELMNELENFYASEPPIPETGLTLIEFLKTPLFKFPDNIELQLKFVLENWKSLLPEEIISKIYSTFDLISDDKKLFELKGGEPVTTIPKFTVEELLGLGDKLSTDTIIHYEIEPEKFTPDLDWMPEVVLLAKNIYVWLYQLSQKYNREITRLDQIPDEELDLLKSYNFNALWLIGIWERSPASRKIKQMTGNPEALASAYSIYDYVIANDLGGEEAFQNLKERCKDRGIRLACDMVPNHMGIFSKWILEHPNYFIQTSYPPFPNYSFTGPDLSDDPRIQIRIEDGYWTRRDAAVVFQLIYNQTGQVRYIYHGNDGTNMPWNDTAQLNLLKEEVREALIDLIFRVANKFSIIRLDAAMTLTQKHYQRLWFPIPGTGGAIPSRSDFAMTQEEFLSHYPKEFWREVVDRFNQYKPNTLLLAEAFWLMEGYFVRTLGMHRVYNSAFMNMLKNEENSKYRELIKNTLKFNPQILKRYVNFLSNPDEETAINQFGDGDKFFGCTVLMVTLPGLPMFAHGQIEGFREKYGHEYRKSYYNESPNEYLIERHKKEIFPLMKKRYLFSQVENFEFYDFKDASGKTIEDVFVYSNRKGNERSLIFYNNSYNTYSGYIDLTCLKNVVMSDAEEKRRLEFKSLGEALDLQNSPNHFYIFKELKSGLEFIRSGKNWYDNVFDLQLYGFEYKIFADFIEIYDDSGEIQEFSKYLANRGVQSIREELIEFRIKKSVERVKSLLNYESVNSIFESDKPDEIEKFVEELANYLNSIKELNTFNLDLFSYELKKNFELHKNVINVLNLLNNLGRKPQWFEELFKFYSIPLKFDNFHFTILKSYLIDLLEKHTKEKNEIQKRFIQILVNVLSENSKDELHTYKILSKYFDELIELSGVKSILDRTQGFEFLNNYYLNIFKENQIQSFLEVHDYEGQTFFRKERFESLSKLIVINSLISFMRYIKLEASSKKSNHINDIRKLLRQVYSFQKKLNLFNEKKSYRFDALFEILIKNKLK